MAGVKKIGKKYSCGLLEFGDCRTSNCDICDKAKDKFYPPFTDTKQLELIKWFGKNSIMKKVYDIYNREDFSQALADLVCELWEDLTDEQREEVKGILQ